MASTAPPPPPPSLTNQLSDALQVPLLGACDNAELQGSPRAPWSTTELEPRPSSSKNRSPPTTRPEKAPRNGCQSDGSAVEHDILV